MSAFLSALRWDVVLQARNGFYWASAFVVLVIGGLLLAVPEAVRSNQAALVPAIVAINLQITTFFFVAGLMLLERDEGTLTALAVSPWSAGGYLATRTVSLTALAAVETINELLLPASVVVTLLLLPLIPHFGLGPRAPMMLQPLQYIAGAIPMYWPMRALWSAAAGESYFVYLAIGAIAAALAVFLAARVFERRLLARA
jgi:hypothetical protein